ncbi:MAG TPA: sigma-70 family RNA polymerase sigma factor [Cryomorphaceae bacterium]|nr:sigma-70 family RNA polymerase sigma factor [Cryomorphaceae bacterium]
MQSNSATDQELVRLYLEGNESAFEALLSRHKDRIYTQVYMLVRDEELANDIFQETFVKVVRTLKLGRYNEEGKFLPWVMRIAHNLSIDHFRRSKKMPFVRENEDYDPFASIPREEKNVEDQWIDDVINEDVRKLVDELPEEQREVVMMRHYGGMSFKEIAERSNVSINTSLGRMRYALINMRKMIEKHDIKLTK